MVLNTLRGFSVIEFRSVVDRSNNTRVDQLDVTNTEQGNKQQTTNVLHETKRGKH